MTMRNGFCGYFIFVFLYILVKTEFFDFAVDFNNEETCSFNGVIEIDGNFIAAGFCQKDLTDGYGIIVKISKTNEIVVQKRIKYGNSSTMLYGVLESGGSYYIYGQARYGIEKVHGFIYKLSNEFSIVWSKSYFTNSDEDGSTNFYKIKMSDSNHLVAAGEHDSNQSPGVISLGFVMTINPSNGNIIDCTGMNDIHRYHDLIIDGSDFIYATGNGKLDPHSFVVAKFPYDLSSRVFTTSVFPVAAGAPITTGNFLVFAEDGDIYSGGMYCQNVEEYGFLAKISGSDGSVIWLRTYQSGSGVSFLDGVLNSGGNLGIVGYKKEGDGSRTLLFTEINAEDEGKVESRSVYTTDNSDYNIQMNSVILTISDGSLLSVGGSKFNGWINPVVYKYRQNGKDDFFCTTASSPTITKNDLTEFTDFTVNINSGVTTGDLFSTGNPSSTTYYVDDTLASPSYTCFTCNGIRSGIMDSCNFPNGDCQATLECDCVEGFYGVDCSVSGCHGKYSNSTKDEICGGSKRGSCEKENECVCNENYYGKECEVTTCDGKFSNSSIFDTDLSPCGSERKCLDFNTCEGLLFFAKRFGIGEEVESFFVDVSQMSDENYILLGITDEYPLLSMINEKGNVIGYQYYRFNDGTTVRRISRMDLEMVEYFITLYWMIGDTELDGIYIVAVDEDLMIQVEISIFGLGAIDLFCGDLAINGGNFVVVGGIDFDDAETKCFLFSFLTDSSYYTTSKESKVLGVYGEDMFCTDILLFQTTGDYVISGITSESFNEYFFLGRIDSALDEIIWMFRYDYSSNVIINKRIRQRIIKNKNLNYEFDEEFLIIADLGDYEAIFMKINSTGDSIFSFKFDYGTPTTSIRGIDVQEIHSDDDDKEEYILIFEITESGESKDTLYLRIDSDGDIVSIYSIKDKFWSGDPRESDTDLENNKFSNINPKSLFKASEQNDYLLVGSVDGFFHYRSMDDEGTTCGLNDTGIYIGFQSIEINRIAMNNASIETDDFSYSSAIQLENGFTFRRIDYSEILDEYNNVDYKIPPFLANSTCWSCDGVPIDEKEYLCTGLNKRATCQQNDFTCKCDDGYTGDECELFQCYGIDPGTYGTNPVCSGHGDCLDLDDCRCWSDEYSGLECQYWSCFGVNIANESTVDQLCGGHGSCIGYDYCICLSGYEDLDIEVADGDYYNTIPCSVWTCDGILRSKREVCNFKGKCVGLDECACEDDYEGENCDTWSCGYDQSLPIACSGNGKCVDPKTCVCDDGYSGELCETNDYLLEIMTPILGTAGVASFGLITVLGILFCCAICCCLSVGCVTLVLTFVCFCIVSCLLSGSGLLCCVLGSQKTRLKKFGKLGDVDMLLKEQELEEDTTVAHLRMKKDLFQIKYEEIKIEKILGEGGSSSVVFLGNWKGNRIAFKCFKTRHICSDEESFYEFEKEVEVMSSISHPHIIQFYGATMKPPRVGIVMEFCENGELGEFALVNFPGKYGVAYPIKEKIRNLHEIIMSLDYLHNRNIIHRDLKLENVLVDSSMHCKLMDFGLSKIVDRMSQDGKTKRIGTNIYMAPEIVFSSDGNYDEKCDVFSFAILCWILVTGETSPYDGDTMNVEMRVANDENFRPSLDELDESLENHEGLGWIKKIVKNCWSHERNDRKGFHELSEIFNEKRMEKGGFNDGGKEEEDEEGYKENDVVKKNILFTKKKEDGRKIEIKEDEDEKDKRIEMLEKVLMEVCENHGLSFEELVKKKK